jgi:hypothetical protein
MCAPSNPHPHPHLNRNMMSCALLRIRSLQMHAPLAPSAAPSPACRTPPSLPPSACTHAPPTPHRPWPRAGTVGMPFETHLSISAMVLGGAFDRLPYTRTDQMRRATSRPRRHGSLATVASRLCTVRRDPFICPCDHRSVCARSTNLRVCFAHGGGAFPYLLGRLENAWHERSIARGKSLHPPSHYLHRFSVDSAVFDARAVRPAHPNARTRRHTTWRCERAAAQNSGQGV